MTNKTWKLKVQFGKVFMYSYEGSANQPTGKGKPSSKIALLTLVVVAVVVALGTAAVAKDPGSFTAVWSVWGEIKPVLVVLLKALK